MASPRPRAGVASPTFAARHFTPAAETAAETDWYRFVLEELNGLGTMLRYEADQRGARVAAIGLRVRAVLDTLGWDPALALRQTVRFVANELHEPHDVWGPYLVLRALGMDPARLQTWVDMLPAPARAVVATIQTQ